MSAPIGHHDMGTLPAIAASATLPQKGDRIHAFWERAALNSVACRFPNRMLMG